MIQRLPPHWCMAPIGECLRRRKESVEPWKTPNEQFAFVGLEDIEDGGRGGVRIARRPGSEIESLKTVFWAGDVLYGKLRPYLNKAAVAAQDGICSTDIWALEATNVVLPEFAFYVLSCGPFVERVSMLTRGANLPRIDSGTFDDLKIPLPPLSEQRRVVEILREAEAVRRLRADADRKTDELIPAVFHEMFGDPEMNERRWPTELLSGLGELDRGRSRHRPRDEPSLYGGPYPFIQTGDVAGADGWIRNHTQTYSELGLRQSRLWPANTLCITIAANIGAAAILTFDACFPDSVVGFTPGPRLTVEFANWCFQVFRVRLEKRAPTGAQKNINLETLRALRVPLPPVRMQREFSRRVAEVRNLKELQASGESGHDYLAEMLRSLLSHAFTGELTAGWRKQHAKSLTEEARQRDEALRLAGGKVEMSRQATEEGLREILETPTDGQWADLTREQQALWRYIPFDPFTPQSIEPLMRDRLGLDADAIRRHLEVFVARGLLLAVSRPVEDTASGQVRFDTVFRQPRSSVRPTLLVALDDEVQRASITQRFLAEAWMVESAESANGVRQLMRRKRVSVIVMKRHLPPRPGTPSSMETALNLVEELRQLEPRPRLVVLRSSPAAEPILGEPWGSAPVVRLSEAGWLRALVEAVRGLLTSDALDRNSERVRSRELARLAAELNRTGP